jgi:hypothetical protein
MAYEAKLPDGVSLPEGHRIDTSDARYKALEGLAEREKWSQSTFSNVLGIEAGRVSAAHVSARAAPAAPAPAPPPAAPVDFDKLSTLQQFAYSSTKRSHRG